MNIMAVDCEKIDEIWPLVADNMKKVLDTQKKYDAINDKTLSEPDLKEHIRKGHGQLLVIHEGEDVVASLMLEVLNTEVGRSLHVASLGGGRIHEWNMMLLQTLKNLAKKYNCDDIRIYMVRKGWMRAMKPYGFKLIGDRKYGGELYPCISYLTKEQGQ